MTYLVVAYNPTPRSRRPHDHFKVEDMAKRFSGVRNGWATVVASRKDIQDAAELLWSSKQPLNLKDVWVVRTKWGRAGYLIKGCDAWLVWYRGPGQKDGVWVRRQDDV